MSLLKVRTWSAIALLVVLQAPITIVGKGGSPPKKRARIDRRIEQIERGDSSDKVRVIVRSDNTDLGTLLQSVKSKGVKVRRTHGRTRGISLEISGKDLRWLESLEGVDAVSSDAPVATAPITTEALAGYGSISPRSVPSCW